jgi:ABC-type Mn2+/Zn2+ transport system permease subunit/Mn-dependent DtxR family transcriptional regulator/Fe2+ transport system protein FeoA
MEIWQILQEPWALRALLASMLVGVTCGMLGTFIVLRNMAMIGDALSHAILPGVAVAFVFFGYNTLGFFFGSVVAGLLAALAITWIQRHTKTKNDAAIGIVFTAMFSAGVIAISAISRTGVHLDLKDFLFGNVLGVADQDLVMTGTVMIMVVLSIMIFYRYLFASTFQPTIASTMGIPVRGMHYFLMLLLSFAVVAAMQTVGVILVVAMLITPAATALLLARRLPTVLLIAAIMGLVSSVAGLLLSILFEMPPGPAIAITSFLLYLMAALFAPDLGFIAMRLRRHRQKIKIKEEDLLKEVFKVTLSGPATIKTIAEKLDIPQRKLNGLMQKLLKRDLIERRDDMTFQLTTTGNAKANDLVRAHRLWETYLVHEMGLNTEHIHEEAERYEHLLTEAQVDEVDKQLGYPALDPHGSPIPGKKLTQGYSLFDMIAGTKGIISSRQPGAEITYSLWDLGIGPGDPFTVLEKSNDFILETEGKSIHISRALAAKISVEPA